MNSDLDPDLVITTLRSFRERIPDYGPLTNDEIISLRRAATMKPEWIQTAINAAGASQAVETVINSTAEEMRREIVEGERWEAVEQELRAFLKGVAGGNLVRRHRLGVKTLQVYGICRQLIRRPEHQDLIPLVEKMKEMRKLGKRKPKAEE